MASADAIISPQLTPTSVMFRYRNTCAVRMSADEVMIEAITNSFQALRNTSRATAASAGWESGRMIDHRLWRRDAPSTAAAQGFG